MLDKHAKTKCRQSPLQKFAHYGEEALRVIGTGKAIYDAAKTVYAGAQAVAPYASAAISML